MMRFNIGKDILPHEYKGAIFNPESASRLQWIKWFFSFLFVVFVVRTLQLGIQSNDYRRYNAFGTQIESRADIIDRNGVVLAKSVKSGNIKLFPPRVKEKDVNNVANVIHEIAPMDYSVEDALSLIRTGRRGIYIKKNANEEQIKLIRQAHKKYDCFEIEHFTQRHYPQRNVFAHVIGFSGKDEGLEGVELTYDKYLRENKAPLRLSIDSRVQNIFHEQLTIAMNKYRAKGAMGMLMNSSTGEMIAMVQIPDFDPNNINAIP
ncbi:MAG: hypothetical protein IK122_04030, partial [Alphaproteobacteria bacterium]|nr:hypothetical protein [Alphaproteobacteria bacterium]